MALRGVARDIQGIIGGEEGRPHGVVPVAARSAGPLHVLIRQPHPQADVPPAEEPVHPHCVTVPVPHPVGGVDLPVMRRQVDLPRVHGLGRRLIGKVDPPLLAEPQDAREVVVIRKQAASHALDVEPAVTVQVRRIAGHPDLELRVLPHVQPNQRVPRRGAPQLIIHRGDAGGLRQALDHIINPVPIHGPADPDKTALAKVRGHLIGQALDLDIPDNIGGEPGPVQVQESRAEVREPGDLLHMRQDGLPAALDDVARPRGIEEREASNLGGYQQVRVFSLLARGPPHHDCEGLIDDVDVGVEHAVLGRGIRDVHGDHGDAREQLPGRIYRKVRDQSAVHQETAVDLPGLEEGRNGHRGPHHGGKAAPAEHDLLPRPYVRRHGGVGNGEVVEVGHGHMPHQLCKVLIELVPRQDPQGAPLPARLLVGQGGHRARPGPSVVSRKDEHRTRVLRQQGGKVQISNDLPHRRRVVPAGLECADQRADARPDDADDGDPVLLQGLDHADMGKPAGSASGEDQHDPRLGRKGWGQTQSQQHA